MPKPPSSSTGCRARNANVPFEGRVAFYGLDLYSLYTSVQAVLTYLDDVDPAGCGARPHALRLPHAMAG